MSPELVEIKHSEYLHRPPSSRSRHGAGVEAVEFVRETLPDSIKRVLSTELAGKDSEYLPDSVVARTLQICITHVDDVIRLGVLDFFPGGAKELEQLEDDEIKRVIQDPDEPTRSSVKIMRGRTGTTALIALVDPADTIHIASLGDCQACKYCFR